MFFFSTQCSVSSGKFLIFSRIYFSALRCQLTEIDTCYKTVVVVVSIGATTIWDPVDASPQTFENLGTKCIGNFATGCNFC